MFDASLFNVRLMKKEVEVDLLDVESDVEVQQKQNVMNRGEKYREIRPICERLVEVFTVVDQGLTRNTTLSYRSV